MEWLSATRNGVMRRFSDHASSRSHPLERTLTQPTATQGLDSFRVADARCPPNNSYVQRILIAPDRRPFDVMPKSDYEAIRRARLLLFLPLLLMFGLGLFGCSEETPISVDTPRPVEAIRLSISDPNEALRLTGTVNPWAAEDVAFEVSGRLNYIVEAGTAVEGRWEEAGKPIVEGDLIGRLDPALFEAAQKVATFQAKTAQVNLQHVLPAQVEAARAEMERAKDRYARVAQLRKKKSISESDAVTARQAFEVAKANFEQAESSLEVGRADFERAQAGLVKANIDLKHTRLYAPFSGEVAKVNLQAGGFAQAGNPVAELVMMDPILVKIIVSQQTDEQIQIGDPAYLYIPGQSQPWPGHVHQKSTVADPATRTFEVTIITRNTKVLSQSPDDPSVLDLPRVRDLQVVVGLQPGSSQNLFVQEKAVLRQDDLGYFVWQAEGLTSMDTIDLSNPTFTVRKVRVTPGAARMNFQGIFLMRELANPGELAYRDIVVANPPHGLKDGDRVALVRESWLLQPGSLVDVELVRQKVTPGFYLPMQAINPTGPDTGYILAVSLPAAERGRQGVAQRIDVTMHGSLGQLQRIEPKNPDAVGPGTLVIEKGLNFIRPGERVDVVAQRQG